MEKIYNELIQKIEQKNIFLNEPMKKHTSFRTGGNVDFFIKVKNIEELKNTVQILRKNNIPIYIMGNGTNILVKDGGIRGAVIKLEFKEIEFTSPNKFVVGAGVFLAKISNSALEKSLAGVEFASGIPRNSWRSNKNECTVRMAER